MAILNRVEANTFCIITTFPLSDHLQVLQVCHDITSLTILYYFHDHSSFKLVNCMLSHLHPHSINFFSQFHPNAYHYKSWLVSILLHPFFL